MTKPILITGALNIETDLLTQALSDSEHFTVRDYSCVRGYYCSEEVVIATTEIGLVNSAICLSLLLERFEPEYVINQGTAGSHSSVIYKNDIVLGSKVVNINTYQTNSHAKGEGMRPQEWQFYPGTFKFDSNASFKTFDRSLIPDNKLLMAALDLKHEGTTHVGTIGSGDVWNREIDRIEQLHKIFGTDCEEMEAYAQAYICKRFGVPFLALRAISNNELMGDAFDPHAAEVSQKFALDLVETLIYSH